ncbi:MAG: hypothetical protein GX579_13585 [Chloroflexi bacterium]|nr:hypothetical protein [Chloroflexota bacterium]
MRSLCEGKANHAVTRFGPRAHCFESPAMDNPPPGYILSIAVERIGGAGPWAEP